MAIYQIVYKEFHKLTISKTQSFDTSSQSDWEYILDKAKANSVDLSSYPSKVPADPMVWYELLSELPPENYDDHNEDLWTANSGTYESSLELQDSEGNQIS